MFGYMNTLHIQCTWEHRPTARAMHCSHLRTQQYFHTQTGFPATTSQGGTSYSCLNLAEPCLCTEHLPYKAASVTPRGDTRVQDLNPDLWNHKQASLWVTRGETTRWTNSASFTGPAPGEDSHLSPLDLLLTPALLLCSLLLHDTTHFSDPDTYSWNTLHPHKWPKTNLALVPRSLPVAERKPSWCGMQGAPSPREKKFLTQNYEITDFKAMEFMHGKPVTGAGLKPAYLAFHMV